ncbi:phosphatase PAP2 family protein [Clostridium botulinum]|uniref:Phosphatidic acid phosphatase n=2 Tax=Clostridium botulinum TaxID=1491 RepID=A0A9Q1ZDX9_CLOBO|nr:phosphatase PAP2 family protein [Clostridium botulinum]AEB75480.1 PAP2 family protein, putative [Clostridium botulinum BKT015925]KEH99648.1 phosphatidic acid phosphatase [Clostridium botulinum D str. 16868]KEI04384.1 phosphatidic acid phosphatase [Clostridium botulinum C/D str. Sp77]KLU74800.1 phosphatidic acid phosphatase [Clostridium botulinum V891]KOA74699.1 phosphatidic acid phosphatase [Clostridium botulinum]
MYISDSDNNKNIVKYYLYLLGLLSIGWITFFIIKLRDSFVTGGGKFDNIAINYVSSIRNHTLNKLVVIISKSGDTITAIIFTILVFMFFYIIRRKKEAWFYSITVLTIAIISQVLKFIVKRPRPTGNWLVNIHGYSFPSGHSVLSMTAALLIIYFVLTSFKNRGVSVILSILIYIYGSSVGLSRVYVGVHYISDVVGGWTLATICVFISLLIFNKINDKESTKYIL